MEQDSVPVRPRQYLSLVLPFTLASLSQPLLGVVDTAVVGRLGNPEVIGGVAIGVLIFNTLYWLLGFLRVATCGFAAQTLATNASQPMALAWLRAGVLAVVSGGVLVALQQPLISTALAIYDVSAGVGHHANGYFDILIWGAPLVLLGYVNLGWLMGRGAVRSVMVLQIGINGLNMLLDVLLVRYGGMGVSGVAYATLASQALGCVVGLTLIHRQIPLPRIMRHYRQIWQLDAIKRMAILNRDLLVRTLCLLVMTNLFFATSGQLGPEYLAANAILFQIQYVLAYLFDGQSSAVAAMSGPRIARRDAEGLRALQSLVQRIAGITVAAIILLLWCFSEPLLYAFTDLSAVLSLGERYLGYLGLYVVAMAPGLVYTGFYVGATNAVALRNAMMLASLVFAALLPILVPRLGNDGLWLSFIAFCLIRSLVMVLALPRLLPQRRLASGGRPC